MYRGRKDALGAASQMALGLGIIVLGTVLLLGNFGMLSVQPGEVFYTYWPLVPLLWGLVGTVETLAKRRQGLFFPLLIFVASGILLGNKLNWWDVSFSQFVDFLWPVMLILLGWFLFREGTRWRGKGRFSFWNNLELDKESELTSDQFIAFMGGIDLDLTKISLPAETVTLHLTAVMGGIDVILPPDLDVVCQGNVFLGGVEFFGEEAGGLFASRSMQRGEGRPPRLVLVCNVILGGFDIRAGKHPGQR